MTALRAALPLPPLLAAIAVVGLVELVLLRFLYRIGLFIPREGPFLDVYRLATWLGSFAFDLATVLALAALAALALLSWRARRAEAVAFGALFLLAMVVPVAGDASAASVAFPLAVLGAVGTIAARELRARESPAVDRIAAVAVALVIALAEWRILAQALAAATGSEANVLLPDPVLGEAAALGAAGMLAVAARARARRPALALGAATVSAVALTAALVVQPYVAGILLLWGVGITLALPLPLYVGAFAALAGATVAELDGPGGRDRAAAIGMLVAAGIVPQATTHALLAVVALAALSSRPRPAPARPRPVLSLA